MDGAALRSVQDAPGMPEVLRTLPESGSGVAAVDVRGAHQQAVEARMAEVARVLEGIETCEAWAFTQDAQRYALYWSIRKGLFPAVGAVRDLGTTVIIEDVAFPIERLAEGVGALTAGFQRHGYSQAILFGHALEGNLHFVFPQGFEREGEVERYQALMKSPCRTAGGQGDGGWLKAEHGNGHMAPYVELEWKEAYALMWRIKEAFDPDNRLNPGSHPDGVSPVCIWRTSSLVADPLVDRCIECGFCESVCPSKNLALLHVSASSSACIARLAALDIPTDEQCAELAASTGNYRNPGHGHLRGRWSCVRPSVRSASSPGDLIRGLRHEESAGADHPGKVKVGAMGRRALHPCHQWALARCLAPGRWAAWGAVGMRNMRRLTQAARRSPATGCSNGPPACRPPLRVRSQTSGAAIGPTRRPMGMSSIFRPVLRVSSGSATTTSHRAAPPRWRWP